ncbi:MAG: FKBP-type peptidyl-prolyl cis-trans isomerase [Verrucomicrobia bacterium]|nr:FKBP-type peptidyl-prolyl cis-trans isomerase [Verrucomicrobiota bacterium]
MRSILFTLSTAIFVLATSCLSAADAVQLKDKTDKISYSLGVSEGRNAKRQPFAINTDVFLAGVRDGLAGGKMLMTDDEMKATIRALSEELQSRRQADAPKQAAAEPALAEKNKREGEAFLEANKKKEGVKTTASGLQYKVIKEGAGRTSKPADRVTTHYRGTLIDGTEFDSSYKRGEPATFFVIGVIKGWAEALQLMKEGAQWQLFIPSELAYGARGTPGGPIGPNATLIFDIELIKIESQ